MREDLPPLALLQPVRTSIRNHGPRVLRNDIVRGGSPPLVRGKRRRAIKIGDRGAEVRLGDDDAADRLGAVVWNFGWVRGVVDEEQRPDSEQGLHFGLQKLRKNKVMEERVGLVDQIKGGFFSNFSLRSGIRGMTSTYLNNLASIFGEYN